MRTIIACLMVMAGIASSRAADTLYISDTAIMPMINAYIRAIHPYDAPPGYLDAKKRHPDVLAAVRTWMATDEGNQHALHDDAWEAKFASFYAMFPDLRVKYDVVDLLLRRAIMLNVKLFYYATTATIVLVDGTFHGVIFDEGQPYAWYRTVDDPAFRKVYETGTDIDGRPWYALINNRIRAWRRGR